jgi:hypothetical protein
MVKPLSKPPRPPVKVVSLSNKPLKPLARVVSPSNKPP